MSIEHNITSLIFEIIGKIGSNHTKRPPMQEEETFEYDGLTYMQRTIKRMQKSSMKSFGTSLSGMKKCYSRLEKEQLELKRQKEEKEERAEAKVNYVVEKKEDKAVFNKVSQENNENDRLFLNKKRGCSKETVDIHGYTPVKRIKASTLIEQSEDFGSMMSKAVKAKPKIQINKERYIEQLQKKKEEEMSQNKANSTSKEMKQVIKLE